MADGGATLCGNNMPRPILVVELSPATRASDEKTRAVLREAVLKANLSQPAYSAVLPHHVWMLPLGSLPRTVKGTVQRGPVEKMLLNDGYVAARGTRTRMSRANDTHGRMILMGLTFTKEPTP